MSELSVLPLTAADIPFVRRMLHGAAFWRGGADAPPLEEALQRSELARYVEGWGRPGDRGFVARLAGVPVGAVWLRHLTTHEPGYGFVDDSTPELSIAVESGHRGRGIGSCLLTAMLAQARLDGEVQVSLSVEADNPAVRLYETVGFCPVETAGSSLTMLIRFRR